MLRIFVTNCLFSIVVVAVEKFHSRIPDRSIHTHVCNGHSKKNVRRWKREKNATEQNTEKWNRKLIKILKQKQKIHSKKANPCIVRQKESHCGGFVRKQFPFFFFFFVTLVLESARIIATCVEPFQSLCFYVVRFICFSKFYHWLIFVIFVENWTKFGS